MDGPGRGRRGARGLVGAAVRRRAQGADTNSARGLLIARRPDDGPCDGDWGRLTYRDASTAEGLWYDGTLIRGDGVGHAHTSGRVRVSSPPFCDLDGVPVRTPTNDTGSLRRFRPAPGGGSSPGDVLLPMGAAFSPAFKGGG